MATSADQRGVLKNLKEEVTCHLCLDIFKDPKRLPCDHVYCKECLHGLALRSLTETITCPECCTSVQVPNHDVSTFTTSHQVKRLIEMYERNLKSATIQDQVVTQPEATCKEHNSQSLALYCDTCKSLVCRDCIITSCSSKNHEYGFTDQMAEKFQRVLDRELEPARKLCQQISSALREVTTAERELQWRKEKEIQKMNATFESLFEILAQERKYCTEAVEKSFQELSDLNSAKKRELSDTAKNLESIVGSVERSTKNEPKSTFLVSSANKIQSIKRVIKTARKIVPYAEEPSGIEVNYLSPTDLTEMCREKNYCTYSKDSSLAHMGLPAVKYFEKNVPINQAVEISLYVAPTIFTEKNKLNVTLCCSYTDFSQVVTVKQTTPEKYSLSFVPQKRGNHKLFIEYNDTHICGSPIPIYVTIEPEEIKKVSKHSVTKTMKGTCAVKYYEGKIYFTDFGTAIYMLNTSTHNVSQIIQVSGVGEFLIHQGLIFITDFFKNRLLKMSITGEIIKAVGEKGDKPGQFSLPNGIRLNRDGKIYVCDTNNNRIQVFDKDLNLLTVIGRKGVGNGCFQSLTDLDFDKHGNLYIADEGNCRVQVLTPQGQHIRNIGKKGSGPGELDRPVVVAIHRNMVYVTDLKNRRISVFKSTGEFVTTLGETILTAPECIAIDENGYIYVTDNRSKLAIF